MICENCGKEHDGSYGSGRFCSKSCSISYGNKQKHRKLDTNNKISEKLCNYYKNHPRIKRKYEYICEKCGNKFIKDHKFKLGQHIHCDNCKRKYVRIQDINSLTSIKDLSKRTITKILVRANKGCSICGWNESTCDIHHIIERKNGGNNENNNLIIVCPNCHRIIHTTNKYSNDFLFEHSIENEFNNWKDYYHPSN